MPRPAKPSLYDRGGVWWYAFTVAGQRFRGSTGERDRARAESFLAAKWHEEHKAARVALPARGPTAALDFIALSSLWLADLERLAEERNPRFVERHKQDVKRLRTVFRLPSDVNDDAWQQAMREMRAAEKPLSWASLRHLTVTLRAVMRFAHKAGAVAVVPELRPPTNKLIAKTAAPRRALSEQERDAVLRAMRSAGDHRAARAWLVMAYTGLRRGELEKLTLRWVDAKAGVIRIPATAAKSGAEELVPLHDKARQAIRAEAAANGVKPGERDRAVFGGFDLRKAWKRALKASGVDKHGLTAHHSARHTFGTLLAQHSEGDVTAVQAGGRWRSLAMVQRYVHASAARARAAVKRL